jgi:hypothetical protein
LAVTYATSILGDYHLAEAVGEAAFVEAYRELPKSARAGRICSLVSHHHFQALLFGRDTKLLRHW